MSVRSYTPCLFIFLFLFRFHTFLFVLLFVFRYQRLIVHLLSFRLNQTSPIPTASIISTQDVTVVIPTVDLKSTDLTACLLSVLRNRSKKISIVTTGSRNTLLLQEKIDALRPRFPDVKIQGFTTKKMTANKREPIAYVLPHIDTTITVLADEHIFWHSKDFLASIIAPFEYPTMGGAAPHQRVRRDGYRFRWVAFWNFLVATSLERQNFELRAKNAVDGGLSVVSSGISAFRSKILQDPHFLGEYTHGRDFVRLAAVPNVDDDNFITGWVVKFQQTDNSNIKTSLTLPRRPLRTRTPKIISQILRWNSTTICSNAASLLTDRTGRKSF